MILNHGKGGGGGGVGGGGGGGGLGTDVKRVGDLGLLYLVRHMTSALDEAGGNDATESVHMYWAWGRSLFHGSRLTGGGGGLAENLCTRSGWGSDWDGTTAVTSTIRC